MPEESVNGRPPWAAVAFTALLLAALAVRTLAWSELHRFPAYDELDYLRWAQDFAGRGGLGTMFSDLLGGVWREDNRHPLLIALLVPLMAGTAGDFAAAKALTLLTGGLVVGAALWVGARGGRDRAFLFGTWAALSGTVAYYSHTVAPDLLFVALYLLAIDAAARAEDRPWAWARFGALAGLAWLTRGNGHFLLLAAAAAAWRRPGRRAVVLGASAAGFAAVAWPLLWRNVRVWGSPFHQMGQKTVWLDDGEVFARVMNSPLWNELGARWYFANHSPGEFLAAMFRGFAAGAEAFARAASTGPSGPGWELLFGAPVAALAAVGLRRAWVAGRKDEVLAAAVPGAALFAAFCWLAKNGISYPRFHLPVVATLVPFACEALLEALRGRAAGNAAKACGFAALAVTLASLRGVDGTPLRSAPPPPFWSQTSSWLAAQGGNYGVDLRSLYSRWDAPPDLRVVYDFTAPPEETRAFLERAGARWVVVDRTVPTAPEAFGPAGDFLGWPLCYRAPSEPNPLSVHGPACPPAGR